MLGDDEQDELKEHIFVKVILNTKHGGINLSFITCEVIYPYKNGMYTSEGNKLPAHISESHWHRISGGIWKGWVEFFEGELFDVAGETFCVLELGKVEVMAGNDVMKLRQRACIESGKEAFPPYWSCWGWTWFCLEVSGVTSITCLWWDPLEVTGACWGVFTNYFAFTGVICSFVKVKCVERLVLLYLCCREINEVSFALHL
jgi:hypothetical protein